MQRFNNLPNNIIIQQDIKQLFCLANDNPFCYFSVLFLKKERLPNEIPGKDFLTMLDFFAT